MSSTQESPSASSALYLGIDAGTSGMRACIINEQKEIIFTCSIPVEPPEKQDERISQSPQVWTDVLTRLIAQVPSELRWQLKAIAIDGTSGTVFFSDAQGQPTAPALMYNDARAMREVSELQTFCPNPTVQAVSAGLPKLMWLWQHSEPGHNRYSMHQSDWLCYLFTRQLGHSDVNNCLKTGYDPVNQRWPDWFVHLPHLRQTLPQVHKPGSVIASIDANVAKQWQLPANVKLISGTTDSHAAILATGVSEPGEAVTSLGSTLVVKVVSPVPIYNEAFGVYSQPFGDDWLVGGGSNSGGAVLREFFTDAQMQAMTHQLQPEQDTGLDYYPLLAPGERFPINDPQKPAKLTPRPDSDVIFFQALLEGMARIEYNAYRKLAELGAPYPHVIYSAGGGAKNPAWTRIRERYCQVPIKQSEHSEASYGSALLARDGYRQAQHEQQ